MEMWKYARRGDWVALLGYVAFVSLMAAGYFYNLTFVQLGLVDLGSRAVALDEGRVAAHMAAFAVVTAAVSLLVGWLMMSRGWSPRLVVKLRLAFVSVLGQTVLTGVVPLVDTEPTFLAWILVSSVTLGIGVPATFGLAVDLVPVRARGSAAALITAGAFFPAAVLTSDWAIEPFAGQMLPLLAAGTISLGVVAWVPLGFVDRLAAQHARPEFGLGRFVRLAELRRLDPRLAAAFVLMFAIYFIDSLGFIRIVETPVLIATTWQAEGYGPLLFIGAVHVVGAVVAGVLYPALGVRQLFLWILATFALLHLGYALHTDLVPESYIGLSSALLYALAVSMYTVVNFAIWADLSTPRTVTLITAVGVALSAWMATFLSTALSLRWGAEEVPLIEHFNVLAALALLFFVVVLGGTFVQGWRRNEP